MKKFLALLVGVVILFVGGTARADIHRSDNLTTVLAQKGHLVLVSLRSVLYAYTTKPEVASTSCWTPITSDDTRVLSPVGETWCNVVASSGGRLVLSTTQTFRARGFGVANLQSESDTRYVCAPEYNCPSVARLNVFRVQVQVNHP